MSAGGLRFEARGKGAHWQELVRSPLVSVANVTCRPPHLGCSHEICYGEHRMAFVRRGAFRMHRAADVAIALPGSVALFRAGEGFRSSHPNADGDDCTFLTYAADVLDDVAAPPDAVCIVVPPPRASLAAQTLFHAMEQKRADTLEAEETLLAFLKVTEPASARRPAASTARMRTAARRAAELIAADPAARLDLSAIARQSGSSPFHLARTFSAVHGQPMHALRTRLRLTAAAERLLGGQADLTGLGLDLGFASHSHFAARFRAYYGLSPSQFRKAPGRVLTRLLVRASAS